MIPKINAGFNLIINESRITCSQMHKAYLYGMSHNPYSLFSYNLDYGKNFINITLYCKRDITSHDFIPK